MNPNLIIVAYVPTNLQDQWIKPVFLQEIVFKAMWNLALLVIEKGNLF